MLQKFLLSGFVLFLFSQAAAQNHTVTGRLREAENGSSVQGATAVLPSIRDTLQQQTTYNDTFGRFRFDHLPRDSFRVIISSVGFETIIRSVKADTVTVDMGQIDLPRSSQELSGVVARTSIPPATQKGDTVQFNASQFKLNPDASAEDLARKMPGITVENGIRMTTSITSFTTACRTNLKTIRVRRTEDSATAGVCTTARSPSG